MATLNELQALKASGILSSAAYIRMQLQATKPADPASFYTISIKQDFPGALAPEIFNELANLTSAGKIEASIPNSFTVTHQDPGLLTSYSPEQVRQLRGQAMFRQKGYLFFCLGADNPGKTSSQLVDPLRITQFYGLSMTDFFGELGRLTGDRTINTDIDRIQIRWIAYTAQSLQADSSTVAIELERIKTSLERLLAEHIQAVDPHPNYATDADVLRLSSALTEAIANFSRDLDSVVAELNDKQIKGEYVTSYQLSEITRNMLAVIDSKQPSGSYAPLSHEQPISSIINLQETLTDIMQAIQSRQASGDYVREEDLQQAIASLQAQIAAVDAADTAAIQAAITNLQQGIDSRNYVVNQTLNDVVSTLQARIAAGDATQASTLQASVNMLQAAIDGKQQAGDYATRTDLNAYARSQALTDAVTSLSTAINGKQPLGNYQPVGNYALQQALTDALAKRDEVLASLQTAINGKQAAGSYAPLVHNQDISTINGLQTALDGKQPAGSYAPLSHTQAISTITGLQTALDGKQPVGDYPLRSEIITSPKVTRSLYSAGSPSNPSIGDVWEAYDSSGDTFDTERWTYNGTYWVSQRRIANWSFNALSAATNFFELLDKYPQKHGILFEWFTIGLKAGASNSSSAYATFTLSRRDSSGVSTALASFTTNTIAASGRLYSMKDIKQSFPYDQAIDAVIALVLTGSPGAMSGSASFSYRYAW